MWGPDFVPETLFLEETKSCNADDAKDQDAAIPSENVIVENFDAKSRALSKLFSRARGSTHQSNGWWSLSVWPIYSFRHALCLTNIASIRSNCSLAKRYLTNHLTGVLELVCRARPLAELELDNSQAVKNLGVDAVTPARRFKFKMFVLLDPDETGSNNPAISTKPFAPFGFLGPVIVSTEMFRLAKQGLMRSSH